MPSEVIDRLLVALSKNDTPNTNSHCTESEFNEFALRTLQQHQHAVWLDSAGPISAQAGKSYLSGPVVAIIEDWGDRQTLVMEDSSYEIDNVTEILVAVECHAKKAAVFSLLTYEGLNSWVKPSQAHPLWNGPLVLWFVAESFWTYDRTSAKCSGPEHSNNGLACVTKAVPVKHTGWRDNRDSYIEKIELIKADIYEGAYYQANLSQRFVGECDILPLDLYMKLRQLNPSPYMGVFRWDDHWILSGSPELLVSRRGDELATRPIAGTRPRFDDLTEDQNSINELETSEKEQAEHLMLVDLARNDLGRIATSGSVRVDEFRTVESYSHVHHLVSHVLAQRRKGVQNLEILRAMFPCGTITGAPKIACMQALVKLEQEARGPYTGSIGIIRPHGDMDFNILIRTIIYHQNRVCLHGGGGIVADSDPICEYEETLHKMQAMIEAMQMVSATPKTSDLQA